MLRKQTIDVPIAKQLWKTNQTNRHLPTFSHIRVANLKEKLGCSSIVNDALPSSKAVTGQTPTD